MTTVRRPLALSLWLLCSCASLVAPICGADGTEKPPPSLPAGGVAAAHQEVWLSPDPLGPPPLWDGIGDSSMTITTRSPAAQRYFDQGLNLMHGYSSFEARRAFLQAIRLDPTAPLPYWGLFMSTTFNLGEHRADRQLALDRMEELRWRGSEREQLLIDALLRLAGRRQGGGPAGFVAAMEELIERYPEDAEVKLVLIKFLVEVSTQERRNTGGSSAGERGREMLRELLEGHPESMAANHYWIHANEYGPDPSVALESAARLPSLAPNNSHILHMPGHVYFLIGDYARAREAFLQSLRADRRYQRRTGVDPADNWNYAHNLDYLVATCAEDGHYREGQRWAEEARRLPPVAHSRHSTGLGFILYAGLTAPARLHLRYGQFAAAAESLEAVLASGRLPSALAEEYLRGLAVYARGMAAAQGEPARAAQALSELRAIAAELRGRQIEAGADWYFSFAPGIVELAAAELDGTLLSLAGRHAEAIGALERAVGVETALGYYEPPHYWRPVLESLAEAHLRGGRPAAARAAYERLLDLRPGSGHAWAGIARTYIAEDRPEEARGAIRRLRESWPGADSDLPQLRYLERWSEAEAPRPGEAGDR